MQSTIAGIFRFFRKVNHVSPSKQEEKRDELVAFDQKSSSSRLSHLIRGSRLSCDMSYDDDATICTRPNPLAELPDEVFALIFRHLPTKDLSQLLFLNHYLHCIVFPALLSRHHFTRITRIPSCPSSDADSKITHCPTHLKSPCPPTSLESHFLELSSPHHFSCVKLLRLSPAFTSVRWLECTFNEDTIRHLPEITRLVNKLSHVGSVTLDFGFGSTVKSAKPRHRSKPKKRVTVQSLGAFLDALSGKGCETLEVGRWSHDPFAIHSDSISAPGSPPLRPLTTLKQFNIHLSSLLTTPLVNWTIDTLNSSPISSLSIHCDDILTSVWVYILPRLSLPSLTRLAIVSNTLPNVEFTEFLRRHGLINELDVVKTDGVLPTRPCTSRMSIDGRSTPSLIPDEDRLLVPPRHRSASESSSAGSLSSVDEFGCLVPDWFEYESSEYDVGSGACGKRPLSVVS
ncbi:hypothetical protein JAAARDRAFT_38715 [Jaapia argillacea MUCL 33604]|uniref:F-box domain-containing protein n=1 Tax=Jaapia argillacea MUCL 33604 TaxID=933084 RepID=A0A067PGQ3_9AGAM|nr:hypothetical protein JAAARDRAFT_38715 [Jaapia argillacea MUCL 33604]